MLEADLEPVLESAAVGRGFEDRLSERRVVMAEQATARGVPSRFASASGGPSRSSW